MRILLITHLFPPKFNAGTENYTLSLAKAYIDQGNEVQVLSAEDWQSGAEYWNGVTEDVYEGVLVRRIHLNWTKADDPNKVLYDSRPVEEWLDQFLAENPFDIVHVTSTHTLGVGTLRSVKRSGTPLVLTLMDFWFICPNGQLLESDRSLCDGRTTSWECHSCLMAGSHLFQKTRKVSLPMSGQAFAWRTLAQVPAVAKKRGMRGMLLNMDERKQLLQQSLTLPDVVITHSNFLQQVFSLNTPVPIKVVPFGLDLTWVRGDQRKRDGNGVRLGFMGQLGWNKGVHVLIDAFQRAQLAGLATLQIWGDLTRNPDYVQSLRDRIGNNQSISLRGRFEQDELETVLAEIDVLVVPSQWYENSPLVIKEAFATNTPVVASNLGGMAEAVSDEVDGLLFERGDADDLARQLTRLVMEPSLIEQLKSGIKAVRNVAEETAELQMIYQQLIDEKT